MVHASRYGIVDAIRATSWNPEIRGNVSFPDLQTFIKALDERGQVRRISAEVDPVLEISAIADRVSRLPAAGLEDHRCPAIAAQLHQQALWYNSAR